MSSTPIFSDIEEPTRELLFDDFDTRKVLEIKTKGPFGTVFKTTSEFKSANGKVTVGSKVRGKWTQPKYGFTLDKLEMKPDGSVVLESYLENVSPGFKFEFKGNDSGKGDLSVIYKTPVLSANVDLDLLDFSKVKGALVSRTGPYLAGISTALEFGKAKKLVDLSALDFSLSYTLPKSVSAILRSSKWFSGYNLTLTYDPRTDLKFLGQYALNRSDLKASTVTLGAVYKYAPATTFKVKATGKGVVSASVKQVIEKSTSAVIAAEVDVAKVSAFKLGFLVTVA